MWQSNNKPISSIERSLRRDVDDDGMMEANDDAVTLFFWWSPLYIVLGEAVQLHAMSYPALKRSDDILETFSWTNIAY